MRRILYFFSLFCLCPALVKAQDSDASEPTPVEPKIFRPEPVDPNWLEYYYTDPKPTSVEAQITALAAEGTLANDAIKPVVIAFLSQVIRQSREDLGNWYASWKKSLDAESLQTIQTAMLFSRTSEADELLTEQFGAQYQEQKKTLPKILEMRLDQLATLDMLWGFYYASGSENAIRRLVMGFRYIEAPESPGNATVPEDHLPLYKMVPEFVGNALIDNGIRHPEIYQALQELHDGLELNEIEKREVGKVLQHIREGLAAAEPESQKPVD